MNKLHLLTSIELYHPTESLDHIKVPDLPKDLYDISGYWLDGQLWICGELSTHFDICYNLTTNGNDFVWVSFPDPMEYLRSSMASMIRPSKSWQLYAIGGQGGDSQGAYSQSVRIHDYLSQANHEDPNVFNDNLEKFPCLFDLEDKGIFVIGQNHTFHKLDTNNSTQGIGGWTAESHDLHFDSQCPKCIKAWDDESLIIFDSLLAKKQFIFRDGLFQTLNIEHLHQREDFQLAILEGWPSILGGKFSHVEQIKMSQDQNVRVEHAKQKVQSNRFYFGLVHVPQSLFIKNLVK